VNTPLLVACFIAILAFSAWAVARDIRRRARESELSAGAFWMREALGYLMGLVRLAILIAVSMLVRSEGPRARHLAADRHFEGSAPLQVIWLGEQER